MKEEGVQEYLRDKWGRRTMTQMQLQDTLALVCVVDNTLYTRIIIKKKLIN